MTTDAGADPKAPAAAGVPSSARWQTQLDMAARDHNDFLKTGREVTERYWSERTNAGKKRAPKRLNILFSNTEVLRSSLYGKAAKPDVRRRFSDRDPVGQALAQIIERTLAYFSDVGDIDSPIEAAVLEHLLAGRGVVRVEYEPVIDGEDDDAQLVDQKLHDVHVFWEDFLHGPARTWAKVPWIAFRHTHDAAALKELLERAPPSSKVFTGDVGSIPMTWTPDLGGREPADDDKKAEVWELWDKASRTRLWVVKGFPVVLRVDEDPYELAGFWPMPRPLSSYSTTESVIPKAEFVAYQDQADDLDELTRRISVLTKGMRRRGVYNQSIEELRRLARAGDDEFIAVKKWGELLAKGGLEAQFQIEDISGTARLLLELYKQRDMLVQAIFELTGISDIARGSTDPEETLGAQQLKASFGSQRIKRRQRVIERWVRDLYRIKAELILSHFDPQILGQIANVQITPDLAQALQNESLISFSVDVETDSTVFQDAAQAQAQRTNLVKGVTDMTTAWAPVLAQKPQLVDFYFELMGFAVAPAQDARQIQDAMDKAKAMLEQQGAQPGAPQPNPAAAAQMQAELAKSQAAQAKAQGEQVRAATAVQVAQIQAGAVASKAQTDLQAAALKLQTQRESHTQDMANAAAQHAQTVAQAAQRHEQDMQAQALAAQAPVEQGTI